MIITVISGDIEQTLPFDSNQDRNLLAALQAAGIYFPALCGGRGKCGKCRIQVTSGYLNPSSADRAYFTESDIKAGYRLACTAYPAEDITIDIPVSGEQDFSAVDGFEPGYIGTGDTGNAGIHTVKPCAIAIDIGTTTIALALVDLVTGTITGRLSVVNRQREYGADVISRMQRANNGDLSLLSMCIRKQLAEGVSDICGNNNIDSNAVGSIAVAGNTTMLHLLLGLSCSTLGQYPFTPVTLDFVSRKYAELFGEGPSCEVVILPGISTYVGADIVADIFFSELYTSTEPVLVMDIGTNGEMALSVSGDILCTATAAGPAFEGGNILWGTGSVPGAISQVTYQNGTFAVKTIDNAPPIGICGSGVVDTVWEGLKNGLILPNGRFGEQVGSAGLLLAKAPDGQDITVCQKDVRELQLAKSAVCSGIQALLHHTGLKPDDIKTLYIAGGFGYNLNFTSGAGIGLIPAALQSKVRLIGNGALGGAVKYLLKAESSETLNRIISISKEYRLPEDDYFNEIFIENINFG
ncbi:hypothetical protein FACS1894130_12390 [Spirochaetia bacterium]|nr:hypothetical protein FACS1894130_12390 [Spirochaetia bacterium]